MVFNCEEPFPNNFINNQSVQNYFYSYNFELSNFQKWAIYSIINGHNTLVTAHTGSGKTLPAEFAIKYFIEQGKKVIYTSPIKALSNQKFNEFKMKFPDFSVGILTGDIKFNPEAQLIIMTTEILRNKLLNTIEKNNDSDTPKIYNCDFAMDIQNECACVIFDEIHYIDDPDRGSVWEQSIIQMPQHISMVMLSASIGKPDIFAKWVESIKNKQTFICGTTQRVVPLNHLSFFSIPDSIIGFCKDKKMVNSFNKINNRLISIKTNQNNFDVSTINNFNRCKNFLEKNNTRIQRKFVINSLMNSLKNNKMFPAICFVFSRRQVEQLAKEVTVPLFTEQELYDDPIPNTIEASCKQLLVSKVSNWKEYVALPEFNQIVGFMKKGVAFHHAGMLPIFKEMIEIMFEKKKIKLLIATETFAVGLNMPTKTVIFSSLYKFNGSVSRPLKGHEYTQMAGRAGRRNIDTIGYVIHLNNLFTTPDSVSYNSMINSPPKVIKSKFKIGIPFILNQITSKDFKSVNSLDYLYTCIRNSFMNNDIISSLNQTEINIKYIQHKLNAISNFMSNSFNDIRTYDNLSTSFSNNKVKKINMKRMNDIKFKYKNFDSLLSSYHEFIELNNNLKQEQEFKIYTDQFVETNVNSILSLLRDNSFIVNDWDLTSKGKIASSVMEAHSLVIADLLEQFDFFNNFSFKEIAAVLSCFYPIHIQDDVKAINPPFVSENISHACNFIKTKFDFYENIEINAGIDVGYSYEFQFDFISFIYDWLSDKNDNMISDCNSIIFKLKQEKNIFLGDFIKCCLKINNIIDELINISEYFQKFDLITKLKEIKEFLLIYVVTNNSLYI